MSLLLGHVIYFVASTCTHGDVRLFGGRYTDHEGVAEVCINGFWADICDDRVSTQTVRTFCRQFIGAEACTYSHIYINYYNSLYNMYMHSRVD